jgi:hypothetical protein
MKNPIKRWIIKVVAEEIKKNGVVIGDKIISCSDGKLTIKTEK